MCLLFHFVTWTRGFFDFFGADLFEVTLDACLVASFALPSAIGIKCFPISTGSSAEDGEAFSDDDITGIKDGFVKDSAGTMPVVDPKGFW